MQFSHMVQIINRLVVKIILDYSAVKSYMWVASLWLPVGIEVHSHVDRPISSPSYGILGPTLIQNIVVVNRIILIGQAGFS